MWDEVISEVQQLANKARKRIREEVAGILDDDYDSETETVLAIADILEGVVRLCQNF